MPGTQRDVIGGISTSVALKAPVKCATESNITLYGEQTLDIGGEDVELVEGDRVLVRAQTNASENLIYDVVADGPWEIAKDSDGARDLAQGTRVFSKDAVASGWFLETADPILPGTTSLTWTPIDVSLSGQTIYANGDEDKKNFTLPFRVSDKNLIYGAVNGRRITDGVINTDTSLVSATANFDARDIGSLVSGDGIVPTTRIVSIVDETEVVLSIATTATDAGVTVDLEYEVARPIPRARTSVTGTTWTCEIAPPIGVENVEITIQAPLPTGYSNGYSDTEILALLDALAQDMAQALESALAAGTDTVDLLNVNSVGATTTMRIAAVLKQMFLEAEDGDGVLARISKLATGDDAAVRFETNRVAKALLGLIGDDELAIYADAGGGTWIEALRALATTGVIKLAQGLQVGEGNPALNGIEPIIWTPSYRGSSTAGAFTYDFRCGYGIRWGSFAIGWGRIDFATYDGAAAGDAQITGWPYNAATGGELGPELGMTMLGGTVALALTNNNVKAKVATGGSVVTLPHQTLTTITNCTVAEFVAASVIDFAFFTRIDPDDLPENQ